MHTGIHTVLETGPGQHEEWVAEQLHGTGQNYLQSGFNWTPIETFRARDRRAAPEPPLWPHAFRREGAVEASRTCAP